MRYKGCIRLLCGLLAWSSRSGRSYPQTTWVQLITLKELGSSASSLSHAHSQWVTCAMQSSAAEDELWTMNNTERMLLLDSLAKRLRGLRPGRLLSGM
eukprot:463923-Amphidinium_carterae.1